VGKIVHLVDGVKGETVTSVQDGSSFVLYGPASARDLAIYVMNAGNLTTL